MLNRLIHWLVKLKLFTDLLLYYLLNWGSVLFHVCKQTDLAAMGHLQYLWIAQWNKARRYYNGHEMQGTEVSRILNYRRLSNSY